MDHIRKTIATFVEKVEQMERDILDAKRMVNMLYKELGEPAKYNLEVKPEEAPAVHGNWRPDEFYGQSLSGAVRRILEARKNAGLSSASINEIYEAMKAGGYQFGSQDDENAKSVLRQSLRKNTAVFHRLPNGTYGLKEWYPNLKERPKTSGETEVKEDGDEPEPVTGPHAEPVTTTSAPPSTRRAHEPVTGPHAEPVTVRAEPVTGPPAEPASVDRRTGSRNGRHEKVGSGSSSP
jgi:hypothetical protein